MKEKNPCSICGKYMKGIQCDVADACPVGLMKKENACLKRRLKSTKTMLYGMMTTVFREVVKRNMSVDDGGFSDDESVVYKR